jgi:hypothetical protein
VEVLPYHVLRLVVGKRIVKHEDLTFFACACHSSELRSEATVVLVEDDPLPFLSDSSRFGPLCETRQHFCGSFASYYAGIINNSFWSDRDCRWGLVRSAVAESYRIHIISHNQIPTTDSPIRSHHKMASYVPGSADTKSGDALMIALHEATLAKIDAS